jgi:hypothetical protein
MNMNKMQVNEEAVEVPSEANEPKKRSGEAEESYVLNPNAKEFSLETVDDHELNLDTGYSSYSSLDEEYLTSRPVVPGGVGVPWHLQILANQLTLSQPGGTDYAHHITAGTPGFSDLPTALTSTNSCDSSADFSRRPDLIYNPYDQSYFSFNQNQAESFSSSPGFSNPDSLHYQGPEEQELYQMNPTCQTAGFYEQNDQTQTEDRNQILAKICLDWEANIEDPNQILAYILLNWEANRSKY